MLTLIAFSIMIFIPIISKEQFVLDKKSIGYNRFVLNYVPNQSKVYEYESCKSCVTVTLREALWLINGTTYSI
jgi:hypothetical protein